MKSFRTMLRRSALSLAILTSVASGGHAMPHSQPRDDAPVQVAAADCYAVGQRIASQNGGTLMQATAVSRGGQTVCRIVVRVPGRDGQRPRRAEFTVPAN